MQILVPFDFSENAVRALDQALVIAQHSGATVDVLHITNQAVMKEYPAEWHYDKPNLNSLEERVQNQIRARVEQLSGTELVSVKITVKESVFISGGVISHMLHTRADLLLMGTHGMSARMEKILGSNTSSIINHALFPVMAIPSKWKAIRIKTIVAAVELTNLNKLAETLKSWAKKLGAHLKVVEFSIVPEVELSDTYVGDTGIPAADISIVKSDPDLSLAKNITQYTASFHDAVCAMFVHERTFFEKIFDSSISEKVSGMINIPLLALPAGKN
ncbi:MAG TPA: universal stress protein [Parasegetibacter sp.]